MFGIQGTCRARFTGANDTRRGRFFKTCGGPRGRGELGKQVSRAASDRRRKRKKIRIRMKIRIRKRSRSKRKSKSRTYVREAS
jgi:hypothetical protein